jgi:hypothetical protein
MRFDKNGFPISEDPPAAPPAGQTSDAAVQAALATLTAQAAAPKPPVPGEVKWHLTTLVYPAILLLFVALYVTSLSAGTQPEVALFQAGGASVVLAVLGRVAVSILGDDTRFVLNDSQIVAMARNGAVRDYLSGDGTEHNSDGAEQPSTAAKTAGAGGKE